MAVFWDYLGSHNVYYVKYSVWLVSIAVRLCYLYFTVRSVSSCVLKLNARQRLAYRLIRPVPPKPLTADKMRSCFFRRITHSGIFGVIKD